jgi:hypothetical protein
MAPIPNWSIFVFCLKEAIEFVVNSGIEDAIASK